MLELEFEFAGERDTATAGFTDRVIGGQRWRLFTDVQNGLPITRADRLAEHFNMQRSVVVVATE